MLKRIVAVALVAVTAGIAYGEAQRPALTYENAMPAKGKLEVGALFLYAEFEEAGEAFQTNDRDEITVAPYARFGLTENLTAHLVVPYKDIDRDMGGDDKGIGDVTVGFELLAFEDVFDYPYVIPHLDVTLDTGDEDEGLGQGDNFCTVGISVGTVVEDVVHFIADASYKIMSDEDNVASGALSIIWDIDERFSALIEGMITDEDLVPDDGHPSYFQGGLSYKATDAVVVTVYGGGAKNTPQDVNAGTKISYSF